jgi:hypothetical protein
MSFCLSFLRFCPAAVLAVFSVAASSCIRWPGEPYMDAVATPPAQVSGIVRSQYPDAEFIGPVYRRHTDTRRGYEVSSQVFLFNDGSGKPHRGEIDHASRLATFPVSFVHELPSRLHASFFDGSSSAVPGGRLDGRAWVLAAPDPVYEFRFASARGSGFGRISDSGDSMAAYQLR